MDQSQLVSDYTQSFLTKLGFSTDVTLTVSYDQVADNYLISLQSPEPSLLIGFHGETLSALKFALSSHLAPKLGAWPHLTVNVNDYNERRERNLYDLADSTITQVLAENQAYALPPLTPSERRLIHVYLANHPQVSTYSEGDGPSRSLIIAPKAQTA